MLSQVDPLLHGVCFDIGFIEINNPLIVVAVTIDVAAQRRFAGAGSQPTKAKSPEKIDGIVAAIMALDRCIRNEGQQQGSIYDERDMIVF